MRALLVLLVAAPLSAQSLFPRFSVTAGSYQTRFSTDVRVDPETTGGAGTELNLERDLGLDDGHPTQRFTAQWRPFRRHELAGSFFATSRSGFESIDRDITFRDEVYPVQAQVTTDFALDSWDATYTYWARRSERDGVGVMLGVSGLALEARLLAQRPGQTVTISQQAETEVPVALAGLQGRVAITPRLHLEGSVATLPEVEIDVYSGSALSGAARVEYRVLRNLGVGAAYNYFSLDGNVGDAGLSGNLHIEVQGVEAFVRLAF